VTIKDENSNGSDWSHLTLTVVCCYKERYIRWCENVTGTLKEHVSVECGIVVYSHRDM